MSRLAETDWQSLTAIPYPQRTRLPCGNCGAPLPQIARWRIVTEIADATLLEAFAAGSINKFSCTLCSAYGDFGEPILLIDRPRGRGILYYLVDSAPEPEDVTREGMFHELSRIPGADLDSLRLNTITAGAPDNAVMLRDASDELFARLVDAERRCRDRRGVFGAKRVDLICHDVATTAMLISSPYERSQELLASDELWTTKEANRLRIHLAGPHQVPEVDSVLTQSNQITEVLARLTSACTLTEELPDLVVALRALAVLSDSRPLLEPSECAQFEHAAEPFADRVSVLRRLLDGMRDLSAPNLPADDGRSERAARIHTAMTSVVGLDATSIAWDRIYISAIPDELESVASAINDGRNQEGLERAEAWESTCVPYYRRTAAYLQAGAALVCGLPQGDRLAEQAISMTVEATRQSKAIDENELWAMAFALRSRANFCHSRGHDQRGMNDDLVALDLYRILGAHSEVARIAPGVIGHLLAVGKTEQAREISRIITDSPEALSQVSTQIAVQLFRDLALLDRPWVEISWFLDTDDLRVLNRQIAQVVDRDHVQRVGSSEQSADGAIERARSVTNAGAILELRVPTDADEIEHCFTTLIGNPGVTNLTWRLASAADPAERLSLLLAIAQIEAPYTASTPGDERLLKTGAAVTADNLVRQVLSIGDIGFNANTLSEMTAARAFACTTYVRTARQAEYLAASRDMELHPSWLVDYAAGLWQRATEVGRAALDFERELRQHRGLGKAILSDRGSISDMILRSYPLALETTGAISEAIDVYSELMPRRELRWSTYFEEDIIRWAQIEMTRPYARFSRCMFARYQAEGDFADALRAADLLEWHRARTLQARGIALTGIDISRWTAAPIATSAAPLDEARAVVFLGWHPVTERIPGRWFAVGLSGGANTLRWACETTPPTRLKVIHDWFAQRMHEVSRETRGGSLPEYLDALRELVPAEQVLARLAELWSALAIPEGSFNAVHLSVEDYALQLPWSAAALTAPHASGYPTVSVVPTTALVGRMPHPQTAARDRVVISTTLPESAFALADAIESLDLPRIRPIEIHDQSDLNDLMDTDTLILLGHGRRDSGLGGFTDTFLDLSGHTAPRTVILLGCWSAHLVQDLSHREVEGLAVSFLAAGAEAVIASLWPVALPVGSVFIARFLEVLSSGASPSAAFVRARDALREDLHHPAIWSGFTLFG